MYPRREFASVTGDRAVDYAYRRDADSRSRGVLTVDQSQPARQRTAAEPWCALSQQPGNLQEVLTADDVVILRFWSPSKCAAARDACCTLVDTRVIVLNVWKNVDVRRRQFYLRHPCKHYHEETEQRRPTAALVRVATWSGNGGRAAVACD